MADLSLDKAMLQGHTLDLWAYANKVILEFSRPGTPTDNAYIESFNGSLRDECFNVHWFADLTDAKEKLQAWQNEYNESRPHMLIALSPKSKVSMTNHKKRLSTRKFGSLRKVVTLPKERCARQKNAIVIHL